MPAGLLVTRPWPSTATVSRERSAVVSAVVPSIEVLFAETGSASFPATLAVLVRTPAAVGLTLIATVALAPLARLPSAQVSVVAPLHDPWLVVNDENVAPDGIGSLTLTSDAGLGPVLLTVIE